jgi:hypothetical protein
MQVRVVFFLGISALLGSAQAPPVGKLNLVVVEGEGAINNIKQRTARDTIVQVEDENHRPVAGAAVVFLLPGDGPGGSFAGGAKTAALVTDSNGQAVMPRLEPNQLDGQFQIRVNASYQGLQGNIVIHQLNAGGGAATPAARAGISGKTIGILAGLAAAGAVGAAVGLRGGGSSGGSTSPPSTPPTTSNNSITGPGTPSLGPPH